MKDLPWIPITVPDTILIMNKAITGPPVTFSYMFAPWFASPGGGERLSMRGSCSAGFLMLIVALLVSSFVIFSALYVAPGNPIATLSGGRTLPPEAVTVLEHRYHLDQPFFVRYWEYLKGVLHGDLGYSIIHREDVSTLVAARIGTTLELVLYASVLIIVIGVGLGLLGGLRPGVDRHRRGGHIHDLGRDPVVRGGDRAGQRVRGQPGLVPDPGQRGGGRRPVQAPDAAGDRAGDLVDGARRAGDAHLGARGDAEGARADGGQPRDPVPRRSSAGTCCATPRSRSRRWPA